MTEPETPDWVRDAVFYQIFPDRFARSLLVPKPSHVDEWGATPTRHNYQGGDLVGVAERLDYLKDLGVNAIYFTPIFQSASNHRYHTHDYEKVDPMLGGDAALRQAARRGPRPGDEGRARRRVQPRKPGFLPVPRHPRKRGQDSAYLDWFSVNSFPLNAYELGPAGPGYKAWWGLPALPKFNTDTPAVRDFLMGRSAASGSTSGSTAGGSTSPNEIDDEPFWREFRRRVRSGEPRGVHRRRGLGRVDPSWLNKSATCGTLGCGDELPRSPGLHRLLHRRGGRSWTRTSSDLDRALTPPARPTPAFRRTTSNSSSSRFTRGASRAVMLNLLSSHDMARFMTTRPRRPVGPPARDPLPDDVPRRTIHLLRRRDRHDRRARPR